MSVKYIIKFKQIGYIRLIGHLDLQGLFAKAIQRAGYKVRYSQGFNPRPNISIVNPLSLGIESNCEFVHIEFEEKLNLDEFIKNMNRELPEGLEFIEGVENPMKTLEKQIFYSKYKFIFYDIKDVNKLENEINDFFLQDEIKIERRKKKKKGIIFYEMNIKDLIHEFNYQIKDDSYIMELILESRYGAYLNPKDLLKVLVKFISLDTDMDFIHIIRLAQLLENFSEINIKELN